LTKSDKPPTLGREALLALAAWVENKNEKSSSNRRDRVGDCSLRTTVPADFSTGKNGSAADKTRINTRGGRE
jgi:hypothetical protein